MGFASFLDINDAHIKPLYLDIIAKEKKLAKRDTWDPGIFNVDDIVGVTKQIMEAATGALVIRCFNADYNLTTSSIAYESDAAHVTLLQTLLVHAMRFNYRKIEANHIPYYDEIIELVNRHDLPENVSSDTPDNGNRDEKAKSAHDLEYWKKYSQFSPSYEREADKRINRLLSEFSTGTSSRGRFALCGDKLAAILTALCYNFHGHPPKISRKSSQASDLNRHEMKVCRRPLQLYFKASELWTVDFLIERRFDLLDDTGFFVAILIMATLLVEKVWYPWRIKEYLYL